MDKPTANFVRAGGVEEPETELATRPPRAARREDRTGDFQYSSGRGSAPQRTFIHGSG
jgi:hypothetical protein